MNDDCDHRKWSLWSKNFRQLVFLGQNPSFLMLLELDRDSPDIPRRSGLTIRLFFFCFFHPSSIHRSYLPSSNWVLLLRRSWQLGGTLRSVQEGRMPIRQMALCIENHGHHPVSLGYFGECQCFGSLRFHLPSQPHCPHCWTWGVYLILIRIHYVEHKHKTE